VQLPTAYGKPVGTNTDASGLRAISIRRWLFVLLWFAVGLILIRDRAQDFYRYEAGTPATATNIACQSEVSRDAAGAHNTGCLGMWTVGGQLQAGPIEPVPNSPHFNAAAPLAVRVNGGVGFTAESIGWNFRWAVLLSLVPILLGLGGLLGVDRRLKQWGERRLHRRKGLSQD
jgi:hypothetical protein